MVVDEEEMKDPVSNFFHISVILLPKHTELCCPALIRPSFKIPDQGILICLSL